jgi:hypothetical protein
LEGQWGNFGRTVGELWKNSGGTLEEQWGNFGRTLEEQWENFGGTLEEQWGNGLSILALPVIPTTVTTVLHSEITVKILPKCPRIPGKSPKKPLKTLKNYQKNTKKITEF